ncbi:MAG: CDP-diacylglycerol--glycerol-3-phosphate 3-phosphatidyltransferase [Gloeobacterales cyanobacterium]
MKSEISLPTWITLSRLLGVPFIIYFLTLGDSSSRVWAFVIFLLCAGTDWLDGYLARKLNQVTDLGKVLDPLVDKFLVFAPLLVLIEQGQIPAWGVFIILTRELTVAGWRANQPTVIGANIWGKAKTVVQIAAIALLILQLPYALIAFWIAVLLTVISGLTYLLP